MQQSQFELIIDNLNYVYPTGRHQLIDINATLGSGTITALLGTNGSGKSTLFKNLTNQFTPTTGTITLGGIPIATAVKQGLISYVPQLEEIDLDFPISVKDVIAQGRYPYINWLRILSKSDWQIVKESARKMDIENLLDFQLSQLSGGQRKRMFLARALAQQSRIIFLDEPFTGVDYETEMKIIEILKEEQKSGKLILIATHNIKQVPTFCSHILQLLNNRATFGEVTVQYAKIYQHMLEEL